ncbi:dihydroneopterin aldolase [Woodsholea maritima]|uniref:dihydroneopterin aldolase n=1 Tax=Woodsholea maritima TaxID=240237 RepID=UPI000373B993|nr:dihydroneopterin aldolase [Woodsholea maritima]
MKLDAVSAARHPLPHTGETMTVRVRSLRLEAEVGVYDSEHGRKQPIAITFEADVAQEATSPGADLDKAVNYAALAETVRQVVASQHHELLEDLVQDITNTVFTDPRILRFQIEVEKLTALADAHSVGVTYERWR